RDLRQLRVVDKRLDAGRAAEHRLQVRKRGQSVEIGMHEREILDIRQFTRFGPDANFEIGKAFGEGVAPGFRVADTLVEIDDEQRHDLFLCSFQRRPAWARALSRSGTLLPEATSPSREPRVTESAGT